MNLQLHVFVIITTNNYGMLCEIYSSDFFFEMKICLHTTIWVIAHNTKIFVQFLTIAVGQLNGHMCELLINNQS